MPDFLPEGGTLMIVLQLMPQILLRTVDLHDSFFIFIVFFLIISYWVDL